MLLIFAIYFISWSLFSGSTYMDHFVPFPGNCKFSMEECVPKTCLPWASKLCIAVFSSCIISEKQSMSTWTRI